MPHLTRVHTYPETRSSRSEAVKPIGKSGYEGFLRFIPLPKSKYSHQWNEVLPFLEKFETLKVKYKKPFTTHSSVDEQLISATFFALWYLAGSDLLLTVTKKNQRELEAEVQTFVLGIESLMYGRGPNGKFSCNAFSMFLAVIMARSKDLDHHILSIPGWSSQNEFQSYLKAMKLIYTEFKISCGVSELSRSIAYRDNYNREQHFDLFNELGIFYSCCKDFESIPQEDRPYLTGHPSNVYGWSYPEDGVHTVISNPDLDDFDKMSSHSSFHGSQVFSRHVSPQRYATPLSTPGTAGNMSTTLQYEGMPAFPFPAMSRRPSEEFRPTSRAGSLAGSRGGSRANSRDGLRAHSRPGTTSKHLMASMTPLVNVNERPALHSIPTDPQVYTYTSRYVD